ncbi:MAG TPA: PHP domain-containing protein [Bacillota bacterium]|nr:PHP domain-containing protein [Bacillota bacterium]
MSRLDGSTVAIDLHIHSALSPCSDDDMTPNNIVNMAILNGLDAIAVTDHNCCDNVEALVKVAGDRLIVIPGMELQTIEEVHLLSYFPTLESMYLFNDNISEYYNGIANDPQLFGNQLIMNDLDEIVGRKEQLLISSLNLSLDQAVKIVRKYSGIVVPAHINKSSYSIVSQLGFIPDYLQFTLLEYSQDFHFSPSEYSKYTLIRSSDAHSLGGILGRKMLVKVKNKGKQSIFNYLINPTTA